MKNKEIEELEKRAEAGDALALLELGEKYHTGDGTKRDEKKAFTYYEKAAKAGNARAQYTVGKYFEDGNCVEKNNETANKWFEKAAKQNNANAQYKLAQNYYNGNGCGEDENKAFELYSKAANLDHAEAQYKLANMYWSGEGCEEDENTAIKWYTESANLGCDSAQNELADIYYNGYSSFGQNYEIAFKWYEKYLEQNDWDSRIQTILANMYYYGNGCEQNYAKAFELFKEAARYDKYAQYCLGWMYEYGQGTEINFKEAESWYRKAAKQGDANALYRLAEIYHYSNINFEVYFPNLQLAKTFYEGAIKNGFDDKNKNLEKLKKEMETYFAIIGTVSEYSTNKTFDFVKSENDESTERKDRISFSFCITGTEGYSVKGKDKNLNIFQFQSQKCKEISESFMVSSDLKFNVPTEFEDILLSALNQHKKIKFVISKTELEALSENDTNTKVLEDVTISLLQD